MNRREFITLLGGAAALWLPVARAQQKRIPVIGFLHTLSADRSEAVVAAFRQGLSETGYIEGRNVAIEYRWAEGDYERLPGLAAEFVSRKVDVIVTGGGTPSAAAAKKATSSIPIVFTVVSIPVELGLVASLARPGGNVTGISAVSLQLTAKRLELLSVLLPQAKVIALLVNPNYQLTERIITAAQEAARVKGVSLQILHAGNESELDAVFPSLAQLHADALIIGSDPYFYNERQRLAALAARHTVAAIYELREFATAGGLISYGPNLPGMYNQAAGYVGRILAGAKPADLPVQQPIRFELVINLKTMKALGLTTPLALLAGADEVIE